MSFWLSDFSFLKGITELVMSFPILVSLVTYPLTHVLSVLFHQRAAKRKAAVPSDTGNSLASTGAVQLHSTVLEESLCSMQPLSESTPQMQEELENMTAHTHSANHIQPSIICANHEPGCPRF